VEPYSDVKGSAQKEAGRGISVRILLAMPTLLRSKNTASSDMGGG